ncbi:MAG TPA: SDR family NAD(P)-dependent oxidoreductase [Chloroflexaceae bacterium]|nr:SDR family NAD(P)-dependent oxidoreductase [Chloroflexaceae bacterium]
MATSRSILIAGASRGIGRAVALAMAAPGARLTLAARSAEALEVVVAEARAKGAEAVAAPCDLTAEPHVRRLVEQAAGGGTLGVVVHSVGGALVGPFEQLELGAWEEQLRAQLTSLFLVCKHAAPRMGPGGLIVNIGSVAARQAFPGWAAYSAAKAGALAFMAAVREELRPRGVRATTVLVAATDTGLWDEVPGSWDRASMLSTAEVAAAVAALAAHPPHVAVEELIVGHVAGRL